MKVTGYKLREAMKRWQLRRDSAVSQFQASLIGFPGEERPKPLDLGAAGLAAEGAIAGLQAAQARYNAAITVTCDGAPFSLLEAVKLYGGMQRIEKMWRAASTIKREKYYRLSDPEKSRKVDEVTAQRTISYEDAAKQAMIAGARVASLREAISVGNAREVDLPGLEAALFE